MTFLGGIGGKIIAGLAAVAALIGAIFLYNRNQQSLGGDKVKARVADEANEASTKMDKAGEKFVKQGAAEKSLKDHNF